MAKINSILPAGDLPKLPTFDDHTALEKLDNHQVKTKTKRKISKIIPTFKEAFVKICSESTSHGLPNIFRNDNWYVKIYWILPLLGGTGAAIYCK